MARRRRISEINECNNNDTEILPSAKKRRTLENRLAAQLQSDFTDKMIVPISASDGPTSRFGRKIKKSLSPTQQKTNQIFAEQSPSLSKRKVRKIFSLHKLSADAQWLRLVSNQPTTVLAKSPIQKLISVTKIGLKNDNQFQNQPTDNGTVKSTDTPIIDLCGELSASEPNFIVQMDEKMDSNDTAQSGPEDYEENLKVFRIVRECSRRRESFDVVDEIDLTSTTEGSEGGGDNTDTKSNDVEMEQLNMYNMETTDKDATLVSNASQNKTDSQNTFTIQTEMANVSVTLTDCVRSTSINSDEISDKPFSEGTSDDCVIADGDDEQSDTDSTDNWYAGKIVWAALGGSSFWPAIIFNSKDEYTFHKDNLIHVKFLYDNGRHNWVNEKTAVIPFKGRDDLVAKSKLPINKRNKAYKIKSSKHWELAICEANVLLCVKRELRIDFYDEVLLHVVHEMIHELRTNRRKTADRCDTPQTFDTAYSSLVQYPSPTSLSPNLNEHDRNYDKISNYLKSVELSHPDEFHDEDLQTDSLPITVASLTESISSSNHIHCRLTKLVYDELRDDEITVNLNAISNEHKFIKNLNALSSQMTAAKLNISLNASSSTTRSRRPSVESNGSGSGSSSFTQQTARQRELARNKAKLEAEKMKSIVIEKLPVKIKPSNDEIKLKKRQRIEEIILGCNMKSHPSNYLLKGLSKDPVCQCCLENGAVMKCAGQCCSYFHKQCLNEGAQQSNYYQILKRKMQRAEESIESTIEENTEQLKCVSCTTTQSKQCFVCNKSDDKCISCCDKHCAKAYHTECLKYWPQHILTYASNKIKNFTCSRHTCHTCVAPDIRNLFHKPEADKKLIKCLLCPGTYHRSSECIPAGSELLSETQMICARHQPNKLSINIDFCLFCSKGGNLICCDTCVYAFHPQCLPSMVGDNFVCEECESGRRPLYGEIVWCRYAKSPWWPAIIVPPNRIPDNVLDKKKEPNQMCVYFFGDYSYGWVSQSQIYLYLIDDENCKGRNDKENLKNAIAEAAQWMKRFEEINEKYVKEPRKHPPYFRKLKTNKLIAKFKDGEYSECICQPDDESPCNTETCDNALIQMECNPALCKAKDRCQNQRIQRGEQYAFQVKMTNGRGWGLFAEEEIPENQFLIEYMGEVIDTVEKNQRFNRAKANKDDNFYLLSLGENLFIDAKSYGNNARFINHSCEPNARTQKWTVYTNGQEHIRIAFFALRKILPGEEITFDYQWGPEDVKTDCQCGAPKCRGSINK